MREMSWRWSVVSADCGHHCCGVLHPILQWCVLLLGDRSAKEGLETVPQARFLQKWVWLARLGRRVNQSRTADLENYDDLLSLHVLVSVVTFSIYTRCKLVHADITTYVRKKKHTQPKHYRPSLFRNMLVSLLWKLISHPFGDNEREVTVRLRNNLRKFAKLATHVEKIAKRFAAEIAACNRPVQTCSVPVQLREFSSNLVSTNLLNVRWAYWLCFSRWWLEQWLASLSE